MLAVERLLAEAAPPGPAGPANPSAAGTERPCLVGDRP
jgi:hypothetical protein